MSFLCSRSQMFETIFQKPEFYCCSDQCVVSPILCPDALLPWRSGWQLSATTPWASPPASILPSVSSLSAVPGGLTRPLLPPPRPPGSVCAAGAGQLALRPGRPALRGPDPADQRAELRRLEHRQGPQGPEGGGRDSHRAGGPGQVR